MQQSSQLEESADRQSHLARDNALDMVVLVNDHQMAQAELAEHHVGAVQREALGHRWRARVDVGT